MPIQKKDTLLYDMPSGSWPSDSEPVLPEYDVDRWAMPVPYSLPKLYRDGKVGYVRDYSEDFLRGAPDMYKMKTYGRSDNPSGRRMYSDNNGGYFQILSGLDPNINTSGLVELSYKDAKKILPKRDYIGGDSAASRIAGAMKIPGFTEKVYERAKAYNIDPNLLLHRILKEGYIDKRLDEYNNMIDTVDQKNYWDDLWGRDISGYVEFGLDYVGDELAAGKYALLDPSVQYEDIGHWSDNEGADGYREGDHRIVAKGLKSAIELMAAGMKYRQGLAKDKYNLSSDDLGIYTNAVYNRGIAGPKMDDRDFVMKEYAYPDYYGKYGLKYSEGGPVLVGSEKLDSLVLRLRSAGYTKEDINILSKGGKIHIKPENRGKFTALKKRTGKSASWFKAHGTPAQKKMAVFALNAKKWKHADGGLLHAYDEGTPGFMGHD